MSTDRINFIRVFDFTSTEGARPNPLHEPSSAGESVSHKDVFIGVSGPNGGVSYFSRISKLRPEWARGVDVGDFVSVMCKVSQFQTKAGLEAGGMTRVSSYFDWLAGRCRIAMEKGKFVESEFQPNPASDTSELVYRVKKQLQCGLALFDAEAIAAHLGSLWESCNPYRIDGIAAQERLARSALNSMVGGDYKAFRKFLSRMEAPKTIDRAGRAFPEDAGYMVSLFRNIALAECFYRDAACQESGQDRLDRLRAAQMLIDECADYLETYARVFADPQDDPVMCFMEGFGEMIREGMEKTHPHTTYEPNGTFVEGYGPTAASVERMSLGGKKRAAIVPYVRMGAKLAVPWPMPR